MDIDLLKDVFFFLGSILGISAFVKNSLEPNLTENKTRWLELSESLSESYFNELEDIYVHRSITSQQLSVLWRFQNEFERGAEKFDFKFPNKGFFHKMLRELYLLSIEFTEEISSPLWSKDHPRNFKQDRYELSKQNLRETYNNHEIETKIYLEHLNKVTRLAKEMSKVHRALVTIANLSFLELLFKRIIVRRAVKRLKF